MKNRTESTRSSTPTRTTKPVAINFHLYKPCDARCRFCFATFRNVQTHLSLPDAQRLITTLREAGGEKLTFAGGEPTLHPHIGPLVQHAKDIGFVTSIVTNGSRLGQLLDHFADALDWAALSADSADERVQQSLGRGRGDHVQRVIALSDRCREQSVRVKLNTVVTSLTWREDMSTLVLRVRPERWKVFRVLRVEGQNDGSVEPLLISQEQFAAFLVRHAHLAEIGYPAVAEDNDDMLDSYVMIDPMGRFYGNSQGLHRVSAPILEVGVEAALVSVGYEPSKFLRRGGRYAW